MQESPSRLDNQNSQQPATSVIRHVVVPLLVLLVAAAILFWSRQSDEQHMREVEAAVRALTEELFLSHAEGPLPEIARRMGVTRSIADRMQEVFDDPDLERDDIRLDVRIGDTSPPFGDGRATHHAILYVERQRRLGLRLAHHGDADHIEVLGYWIPDVDTMP